MQIQLPLTSIFYIKWINFHSIFQSRVFYQFIQFSILFTQIFLLLNLCCHNMNQYSSFHSANDLLLSKDHQLRYHQPLSFKYLPVVTVFLRCCFSCLRLIVLVIFQFIFAFSSYNIGLGNNSNIGHLSNGTYLYEDTLQLAQTFRTCGSSLSTCFWHSVCDQCVDMHIRLVSWEHLFMYYFKEAKHSISPPILYIELAFVTFLCLQGLRWPVCHQRSLAN